MVCLVVYLHAPTKHIAPVRPERVALCMCGTQVAAAVGRVAAHLAARDQIRAKVAAAFSAACLPPPETGFWSPEVGRNIWWRLTPWQTTIQPLLQSLSREDQVWFFVLHHPRSHPQFHHPAPHPAHTPNARHCWGGGHCSSCVLDTGGGGAHRQGKDASRPCSAFFLLSSHSEVKLTHSLHTTIQN